MRAVLHDSWQRMSRTGTGSGPVAALLPEFAVLRFSGGDVLSFLQGYLTVDTGTLSSAEVRLTALTNLQGRVVANGWCTCPRPDVLDWTVHRSLADHVIAFLGRYLAFSRTSAEVRTDDHLIIGVLNASMLPSVRVVDDESDLRVLLETHTPVSADRWQLQCVDDRLAVVSRPTSESFLPQMLDLVAAGAVDFDKGCYLGQEVVARAQHRGEVKRGLLRLEGPAPLLAAGDFLTDPAGRQAGTVISSVATESGQRCLAVVRLPPGTDYRADSLALSVY